MKSSSAAGLLAPRINNFSYGWSNISILINSVLPTIGITAISYKQKNDLKPVYAFGNTPVSYSMSNIEFEGSIELLKEELPALQLAARTQNPLNIEGDISGILPFTIIISYLKPDNSGTTTDTLVDVMFLENGVDVKQGDGTVIVKIPIILSQIKWGS